MCGVTRAEATWRPHTGHGTQHGTGCMTASGALWHGQSHTSPGGGVGTNFMSLGRANTRYPPRLGVM